MKGHIAKKGNRYYVVVYIDGKPKWHSVPDPSPGKSANKDDAENYSIELLHKINNNMYTDNKNMTFGELLKKWIENRNDLAPKTFKRYKEIIELHLIPALGKIQLNKLKPLHLQDYYDQALKKGRIGKKYADQKGLSSTTVLHHHRLIHNILNQAVKWELVTRNVADAVRPPKMDKSVKFEPNLDIILKVLNALRDHVIYMPCLLAISTGARRGEVMGMHWKDYAEFKDDETELIYGRIRIVQTLQRVPNEGLKFLPPKTPGSRRLVELPPSIVTELKRHKASQEEQKLSLGDTYKKHDLICSWNDGRPIDPDYVTKQFEKITADMDHPEFRFHDLRHAHATFLLAAGVDPKTIQGRLGHTTVSFTLDQYSHVISSMQHHAAMKTEEILFPKKQPEQQPPPQPQPVGLRLIKGNKKSGQRDRYGF